MRTLAAGTSGWQQLHPASSTHVAPSYPHCFTSHTFLHLILDYIFICVHLTPVSSVSPKLGRSTSRVSSSAAAVLGTKEKRVAGSVGFHSRDTFTPRGAQRSAIAWKEATARSQPRVGCTWKWWSAGTVMKEERKQRLEVTGSSRGDDTTDWRAMRQDPTNCCTAWHVEEQTAGDEDPKP